MEAITIKQHLRSLKRVLIVYFVFTTMPQISWASNNLCSNVFGSYSELAESTVAQILSQLKTPHDLHLLNIALNANNKGMRDRLRKPLRERLINIQTLRLSTEKFRTLTDAELKSQWGGESELNLPTDHTKYKYLGPVEKLRRGDVVKVTRTIELSKRDLEELLQTKIVTSNHLNIFNYNLELTEVLNRKSGLASLEEIINFHINTSSSSAISTTYAVNGWKNASGNQPLEYNPYSKNFLLRLEFNIPVEAIVNIGSIPDRVRKDPHGFAFFNTQASWVREHELTFYTAIPAEWVTTDFAIIRKILDAY